MGTKAKTYLDMLPKYHLVFIQKRNIKLNKVNNELYICEMDLLKWDSKENIINLIIKKYLPEIESYLNNKSNINPTLNIEEINKLKKNYYL